MNFEDISSIHSGGRDEIGIVNPHDFEFDHLEQ